jgi:membrane-associated phospholipid phosphatase
LLDASAALTDAQKAAAEYWAPWGSSPASHLIEITKFFSDANDLRLDDDAKLFFAVSNAILDASIATWEAKYHYDYVRPITAIRALGDRPVRAWHARSLPIAFAYSAPLTRGLAAAAADIPSAVPVEMRAADWQPYLPTLAFPAYVSGHSAMTAAWARVMELVTGGAELRLHKTVRRLFVEQRDLAEPVTLDYTTFASAVTASGMSRIWGGIHWPADDIQGRALGEHVGENAWQRARQFVLGTASPAAAVLAFLRPPFWFRDSDVADASSRPPVGSASTCRPAVTRCGAASSSTRCRQATMS